MPYEIIFFIQSLNTLLMKNILPLLLIAFLFTQSLIAQNENPSSTWTAQAVGILPPNYGIFDIHVVDENTVWATAIDLNTQSGIPADHITKVIKTEDGGANWSVFDVEETMGTISFDIHAFDNNRAWISTQDFATPTGLWLTEDGGVTWTQKYDGGEGGVWVHFFNDMEGIAINTFFMVRTADGGETWTPVPMENIPPLEEGEFTQVFSGSNSMETRGDFAWAGSSKGRIYRTSNKGLNWEVSNFSVPEAVVHSIAFKDTSNGLAVSSLPPNQPSIIAATTDGGATWETISENNFALTNITFVEGSESSYIGASFFTGLTAYSNDGGATWAIIDDAFPYATLQFASPTVGWVGHFGNDGTQSAIFKWNNQVAFPPAMITSTEEQWVTNIPLTVFPMPFKDQLNIILDYNEEPNATLQIIDMTGKQVIQSQVNHHQMISQDFSHLPNGIYNLKIQSGKYLRTVKIIKQ